MRAKLNLYTENLSELLRSYGMDKSASYYCSKEGVRWPQSMV